jgi:hypothetical protein
MIDKIDIEMMRLRGFDEAADEIERLRAALAAQPAEPVAHLYQHCETGRTRIVPVDAVADCDARWDLVGPLYLAAPPAPGG